MFTSAPRGVLTVTLIEAAELKKEDFNGSDPFVELWLNKDFKQKSDTVKNDNNPVWNQTFTFNIEEGSRDHKLYFKVYDKDVVDNDKIGEGHFDIAPSFNGETIDTWSKLPSMMGLSDHGKLHFNVTFSPQ